MCAHATESVHLSCCTLRPWRRSDVASLVRHANDREVWRTLRDRFPHPYTDADAHRWIDWVEGGSAATSFAIDVDGAAVGGIGVETQEDVYRRSAEIGYWLGRTFWGRGIMTEVVKGMTAYTFESRPEICRMYASVFEWNAASARVLEKAGYTLEGRLRNAVFKDGRLGDKLLYAILREEL